MRPSSRGNEHSQARRGACVAATLVAGLSALLSFSGTALAAGTVDSSFGTGGGVSFGSGTQLFGVAGESDGGVVVAGTSGGRVLVERLAANGQVTGSYHGPAGYARSVAVAPDGSIAIAGSSGGAMLIQRLTPTLGVTWSASAFAGQGGIGYGVSIGPDDSVAAGGSVAVAGTEAAVARFSSSGATQWSKIFAFGGNSVIRGVALQPADGKVVLVGSQNPGQPTNGVIARLTTAGALDSAFAGGQGAFVYSFPGSGFTALNAVALQSNGQIVAAGSVAAGPTTVVLRINSNGTLDGGFGGGAAHLPAGQNVSVQSYPIGAYGVAAAAGGHVVASGNYENTGVSIDHALWAFNSGGAPEAAFGSGGLVRGPAATFESCGLAVVPSGNLVSVGNLVTTIPDSAPCSVASGSAAFALRYTGFGPVPFTPPPTTQLKVTSSGISSSYKKSTAHRSGVSFKVGCNEACKIQVSVGASATVARQLHIGKRTRRCTGKGRRRKCVTTIRYSSITVATASAQLSGAGTKSITLNSRGFKNAVNASKKGAVKLSLKIVVTAGTSKSTTNKTLTFK